MRTWCTILAGSGRVGHGVGERATCPACRCLKGTHIGILNINPSNNRRTCAAMPLCYSLRPHPQCLVQGGTVVALCSAFGLHYEGQGSTVWSAEGHSMGLMLIQACSTCTPSEGPAFFFGCLHAMRDGLFVFMQCMIFELINCGQEVDTRSVWNGCS